MIIDVKKYLIIGVKEEIDAFFLRAQEKGIAEFISAHPKKSSEFPLEIQHLLQALKILRKLPVKKPYLGGGDLQFADERVQFAFYHCHRHVFSGRTPVFHPYF